MIEKGVSHIAYFRLDGGSSKLYTQEYVDEKDEEIKRLKEEYVILQNASDEVEEEKDKEIERLNNIINEIEKEIDRLLERQYKTERFAKENGFSTYLPAKENLLCIKNKLQELKEVDKE